MPIDPFVNNFLIVPVTLDFFFVCFLFTDILPMQRIFSLGVITVVSVIWKVRH